MKIIAYFLYGNKEEYQLELALSIISAIECEKLNNKKNSNEKIRYCVITDQLKLKYDLPVEFLYLAPNELEQWTDHGKNNHRAKPYALLKAIDHYKTSVVMVDTDTYFIDNPKKLFEKITETDSVMHDFEHLIGSQSLWDPLLRKINGQITIGDFHISAESAMFNSGVIGVSFSNRNLIKSSLEIIDRLYQLEPIFNIEQFAVGTALGARTTLHTSRHIIAHYWGMERDFVRIQGARILKDSTQDWHENQMNFVSSTKFGLPKIPFHLKVKARLISYFEKWTDAQRFSYLCSLCSIYYDLKDPEYAAAWKKLAG